MSETSNFEELYGKTIDSILKKSSEVTTKTLEKIHATALPKIKKDVNNIALWLDKHAARINNLSLSAVYDRTKDSLLYIKQGLKFIPKVEKQLSTLKLLCVEHTNRNNTVILKFEKDCYIELTCNIDKTRFFKLVQKGKRLVFYSMLYRYKKSDSELEKEIKKIEVNNLKIIGEKNNDNYSFSLFNMDFLNAYEIFYKTTKYLQLKTTLKVVEDMYEKEYDILLEESFKEFERIAALLESNSDSL